MILTYLCVLSLLLWTLLLLHPDQPHLFSESLPEKQPLKNAPKVSIVIPCRNEEQILETTLQTLTNLDYDNYEIILVDDCSTDATRTIAEKQLHKPHVIVSGKEVPEGWAGKMWALEQGIANATGEWILLSDADIAHNEHSLSQIVSLAVHQEYDLVSVMVSLSTKSFWEKLLVPAFVYFFKILYPFRAIRSKKRKVAAAAGGCVLIKKDVLQNIGGIRAIHGELIDDVALAKKVKSSGYNISLWLDKNIRSIRSYIGLEGLWAMVARSAFTELKYSYMRLLMCTFGLVVLFMIPVYTMMTGIFTSHNPFVLLGSSAYITMMITYLPAIRFYNVNLVYALLFPFIGVLYMLMTLDSARKYTFGVRATWKDRSYKN
ncbi:glycosyltransferase [Candidatus Uabimicrobium amorphum]|uniref:Glycosyl transferase family 2 n=1 Tax=Uabimicrobium amorphum TaxID=2596890 RepID=A0A5S9F3Z1_UABAM|nr:glycosyltransferase [Candidatus Uabimicrobium amorphum]BBM85206.1 glycosyl transferase family 2 [Candidatus Uabimicrobium amorphum]